MAKDDDRKSRIEAENRRPAGTPKEHPEGGPEPDTLEGPGDRHADKGESDASNKVTRRGER